MTTSGRGAAVVTGAAGGLGRATAAALHADGWRVLLTDVDATAVAAAAEPLGGWSHPLDVRDEAACAAVAAEAADAPGGLGLWVNNAGILVTGPSWAHDAPTRRRVVEVNTLGAMNGTQAALAVMRRQGRGHVLNIVSLAGLIAAPGETVYAASKHALLAFSLGTLADLRMAGVRGVHVSCLCPDGIWTPMLHDKLDDPGALASFTGALLTPERVAARAVRLARRPRPVVSLPRWRGAQVRLLDTFPRLALALTPVVRAAGRAGQRRQARRVPADPSPPRL
ncbi:NADP-dependent 3-hydroxy acid dehydrogenase YdfG [Micromonospora sediminicola]|uniref:NADP-dependent 3-hydroxy acid dehydrogenase YdfG n=1 Tax=Micromonospora sediminicola TaxID=946078 RepID=A0A1A9B225_9ACTN|nr:MULTISPECIES: SDR family oxidoreductase [Micromonospora]PGH43936.1 NAD(P)-dependent oxidoreductase [Micromonospora sp. WMMA1996]SBT63173.1 NADP-dependent 3-hydroxy acid dehydrogenase YdfG [Micromonospora sediminicola]